MTGLVETEVKIAVAEPDAIRDLLNSPRFPSNCSPALRSEHSVRHARFSTYAKVPCCCGCGELGGKCIITWKGPGTAGPHKSRPEMETPPGPPRSSAESSRRSDFSRRSGMKNSGPSIEDGAGRAWCRYAGRDPDRQLSGAGRPRRVDRHYRESAWLHGQRTIFWRAMADSI